MKHLSAIEVLYLPKKLTPGPQDGSNPSIVAVSLKSKLLYPLDRLIVLELSIKKGNFKKAFGDE